MGNGRLDPLVNIQSQGQESREVLVDSSMQLIAMSVRKSDCAGGIVLHLLFVVLPLEKYGRRRNLTNAAAEKVVEGKNGENGLGGWPLLLLPGPPWMLWSIEREICRGKKLKCFFHTQ